MYVSEYNSTFGKLLNLPNRVLSFRRFVFNTHLLLHTVNNNRTNKTKKKEKKIYIMLTDLFTRGYLYE